MAQTNYNRKTRNSKTLAAGKKHPPINIDTKKGELEINYFNLYQSLYRREIRDWQYARESRRNPVQPLTYLLQQLYQDAMLDNHLQGAINNRIFQTLNKEVLLKDKNGSVDIERSAMIQTRQFKKIIRSALESKFFGYSMLFLSDIKEGQINNITEIQRENVIPEMGIIVKDMMSVDSPKIYYKDFPQFFLYIQLNSDAIGDLERLAPLTIYKRHSWGAWDEFEQVFGVPIRIARTNINTEKHKNNLQSWLDTMGTANYAIFDKQTDIEIKENSKSDSFNVFLQKIQAINTELSKGVIGQTMTMDNGSSQSQAEVHLQTFNQIVSADVSDIQDWATDDLLPVLRMIGYDIPEGYYVAIQDKISINPQEKIKIDAELLRNGLKLSRKYLEDTYEIEFEGNGEDIYRTKEPETLSFFQ